ncbi:MAG: hypothetical protein EON57_04780 [Alphaproteobacteria bacterium]|nr:MAG: hypothetical protein EON57_04780 [Alphaproteobacteria bacterium]
MPILIEIVLVVALVALGVNYLFRGRRNAQREELLERRVAAYMQTIRREGGNPELAAMNDVELRDVLLSGARNLRVQSERKWYLILGGGLVAFFAAIMVATQDGTRGFGIAILIGAIVLYGVNEFLGRRMREPLVARGIDVERLRVE